MPGRYLRAQVTAAELVGPKQWRGKREGKERRRPVENKAAPPECRCSADAGHWRSAPTLRNPANLSSNL